MPTSSSSPPPSPLSALAIFRNVLNNELIRSVHVYRDGEGSEERWVEREFIFSPTTCVEIRAAPMILLDRRRRRSKFLESEMVGLFRCVLAFDSGHLPLSLPPFLCFSRNPRLKSIPALANDLQEVYQLMSKSNKEDPSQFASSETFPEKEDDSSLSQPHESTSFEDQFCRSSSPSLEKQSGEDQPSDQLVPDIGMSSNKRRAATDHVASISLTELARYFNLPITEASKRLKVGLTVLKRKCREFGIPRWPHRKIKSLDTLIHNLQEEVSRQQSDNRGAAVRAAKRRQRMLEIEKEGIERSPFMELQKETKRFRQDVFKRRHKAKALNKLLPN